MKKLLLLLLVTSLSHAAISNGNKYKLNTHLGQSAAEAQLGTLIDEGGQTGTVKDGHQAKNVLVATYDFSVDGGASLVSGGEIAYGTLPRGAIITKSYFDIITAPVGTGSSLSWTLNNTALGSGEVKVQTAVGTWAAGFLDGATTATASYYKNPTANTLKLSITGNALTAGKIRAFVEYVMSGY